MAKTNDPDEFPMEEATIRSIHEAFSQNKLSCRQLVEYYLNRIETLNPHLRAVVEVNPDALTLADEADKERLNDDSSHVGPLRGIPVLIKDTIATKDKLSTTAGSHALVGSVVAREATVVERLRQAGALILGKASLSEWYKIRSIDHLPNGWCSRAGQGLLRASLDALTADRVSWAPYGPAPYKSYSRTLYRGGIRAYDFTELYMPDRVVRQLGHLQHIPRRLSVPKSVERPAKGPCKVEFVDANVSADWAGFPICSKMSVIDVARTKHVPWEADVAYTDWFAAHSHKFLINNASASQSTVDDQPSPEQWSYIYAGLLERGRHPPQPDEETVTVSRVWYDEMVNLHRRFLMQILNADGLRGKRLGIVRHPFVSSLHGSDVAQSFEHHLQTLRDRGAILVDNLEISHINEILNPHHSGEIKAMLSDFKHEIKGYLNDLESSPVRSLSDIIAFNDKNPQLEKTTLYGQDGFIEAEKMDGNEDEIREIVEQLDKLCKEGFEKMMEDNELDAMVTPGIKAIPVMAIGGYPGITVPAGYDQHGVPFGMLFSGLRGTEPKLIEIAFAFEQATLARKPPPL